MYPSPSEDDGLWDELSHAQSREIQQHQYRVAAQHGRGGKAAAMALGAAQKTASAVWTATSSAFQAASNVASTAATNTYYRHIPTTEDKRNLSEFGLQSEYHRSDPLLIVREEHNDDDNNKNYGYNGPASPNQTQQPRMPPTQGGGGGEGRNEFVFLQQFRLLPKKDGWGAVSNLDMFFSALYSYYYHGGLIPIVGKGIVELITLFFTIGLSVFLFAYLDWTELVTCTDESTCHSNFSHYIIEKPFHKVSLWNLIVILYCILSVCYGLFSAWGFLQTITDALEAKYVFEEKLGIPPKKLEGGAVDWDKDVVMKLISMQESGEYRIAIHGQELDALVVAHRILRKENFLVAFFNRQMLDFSVPLPWLIHKHMFCKSLEWCLHFCVLNFMFNHKYEIRPSFCTDPSKLKRRFVFCGIAHGVLLPFLLFFMTLHFSMSNVYDWKSSKQYLGPREWSLSSKWIMREFNELPHIFERRLGPSYKAAEDYLKLFTQSAIMTSVGRIMAFIGGSLGVVLIALAAVNDSILLHVKIGDWNLLWYVGILGVLFSTGKSMLPDPTVHPSYTRNLFAEMDKALGQVATHTHHYPDIWKGRGWDERIYKEFGSMFKYKAQLFAMEIGSMVFAPLILCFSLPECAEHLCDFVMKIKREVPGAGDVCGYATFDFDTYQDENWEGRTMGVVRASETVQNGNDPRDNDVESGVAADGTAELENSHGPPKARQGKMEKSFFGFKAAHTSWKPSQSGQKLVEKVEKYRQEKTQAIARERQLHIEAAVRQLETLNELEHRKHVEQQIAPPKLAPIMDESYIEQKDPPKVEISSGADSGGGGTVQVPNLEKVGIMPSPPFRPLEHTMMPPSPSLPSRTALDSPLQTPVSVRHGGATPPPFASSSPLIDHAAIAAGGGASHAQMSPLLGIPNNRQFGAARSPSPLNQHIAGSVLHYADIGLSTELRQMLNRSTLDALDMSALPGSVLASTIGPTGALRGPLASRLMEETGSQDTPTERQQEQYLWLEQFHSYLAEQEHKDQQEDSSMSESIPSISVPRPFALHASAGAVEMNSNNHTLAEDKERDAGVAMSSIL
eukprot:CAMPEP_0195303288 /NCGR_PEP_ID=MMETSP0707-20130614/32546_1 /TAXON_ID=33640 /ORGANISM="Asterionellopsis glacialis, Strain CCMP134" /LENGTH=1072 /DNA_ID=CAMNT_0040366791 /DNA_START=61 /DNA_END=3279 /DNA_ORIENTATION=-